MFRIEEYSVERMLDEYSTANMLSRFFADSGRLYFSSPNFCVDVSTSRVSGYLKTSSSNFDYSDQFGHRRWMEDLRRLRVGSPKFVLQMEFEMESAGELVFPFSSVKRHCSDPIIEMDEIGDTALLVDSSKMPKPIWRPIWLPGGVWQCSYCASSQLHDLLQCRNCGAPRYDDLRKP